MDWDLCKTCVAVAENRFDNFMQATRVAGRSKK